MLISDVVILNNSQQYMLDDNSPMQVTGNDGQLITGAATDQTGMSNNNFDMLGQIFCGSYGGLNEAGQTWM